MHKIILFNLDGLDKAALDSYITKDVHHLSMWESNRGSLSMNRYWGPHKPNPADLYAAVLGANEYMQYLLIEHLPASEIINYFVNQPN